VKRWFIAAASLVALVLLFAVALRHDPRQLPSALIGEPAPHFSLPRLAEPDQSLSSDAMRGKVWILNVWASWCEPCRTEHAALTQLAAQRDVHLYGLNYKDDRGAALQWLAQAGDPYTASVMDASGRVAIDYGVYGVPETFVIDREGRVRYRVAGALTEQTVRDTLLPLVARLRTE
jgi:cytochrome c biogenesis protein CcmG, thiol:disulfide interchange protein DsbE